MRTFHIPIKSRPNRRGSLEGPKPVQLGNLLFEILVKFQTRAVTNKNEQHVVHSLLYLDKKGKEDDHLF